MTLRRPRGYLVASAPRTGSTLLCQLLATTGVLGDPREWFNAGGRRAYDGLADYADDPEEQLAWMWRLGTTPNGVYGLKLHAHQLAALPADLDLLARLPRLRAVRVVREDVLGQAISWSRARRSGAYRASDGHRPVDYDAADIAESLGFVQRETAAWEPILAAAGIESITVTYEQVEAEPQAVVDRIAGFVGVRRRARADPGRVVVRRMRDATTEEWRARYLADV